MEFSIPIIIVICGLFFAVALGYIAILSFFYFPPMQMSTTALILNLLVAGTAFVSFL